MKATYQPIDRDKARFDFLSPRNQLLVRELWRFGDTHGASVELSVFPTISIRIAVFHPPKKPLREFKIELDGDQSPADLLEDVFRYLEIPFDLTSHGTYYGLNWNTALEWVTDENGEKGFWATPGTQHSERFTNPQSLNRGAWVGFDGKVWEVHYFRADQPRLVNVEDDSEIVIVQPGLILSTQFPLP